MCCAGRTSRSGGRRGASARRSRSGGRTGGLRLRVLQVLPGHHRRRRSSSQSERESPPAPRPRAPPTGTRCRAASAPGPPGAPGSGARPAVSALAISTCPLGPAARTCSAAGARWRPPRPCRRPARPSPPWSAAARRRGGGRRPRPASPRWGRRRRWRSRCGGSTGWSSPKAWTIWNSRKADFGSTSLARLWSWQPRELHDDPVGARLLHHRLAHAHPVHAHAHHLQRAVDGVGARPWRSAAPSPTRSISIA